MYTHQSIVATGVARLVLENGSRLHQADFMKPLAEAATEIVRSDKGPLKLGQVSLLRRVLVSLYQRRTLLVDDEPSWPPRATFETALAFLGVDAASLPDPEYPNWGYRVIAGEPINSATKCHAITGLDPAFDGACLMFYRADGHPRYAVLPSLSEVTEATSAAFEIGFCTLDHVHVESAEGLEVTHASAAAWLDAECLSDVPF